MRDGSRLLVSVVVALVLGLAGSVSVRAQAAQQEDPAQPAEIFFETIDVNLVNVEVYVTDREGNPVTDLAREEFELFEDGRRVEITHFHRVEGGRLHLEPVLAETDGELREPRQAPAPLDPSELPLPEEQRLHLVVYIDNLNIRPFNRNRVFTHLRGFLHRHLTRDDRVMLVTYERSFNIRRPFTFDPAVVAEALEEIEVLSAHGVHADSDRRDIIEAIQAADSPGRFRVRLERYAESRFNDLANTVSALRDFIDSLAGVPGRKALLYVSDGLPMIVAEDAYYAANAKFPNAISLTEMQRFDLSRRFESLAAQANANRVTFYTLDAAGLRAPSGAAVTAREPGLTPFLDTVEVTNLQSTLRLLAERTGGRAVINTNDFTPDLDRIAVDFGYYYSLGYRPAHPGDGRYHRIEVKVNRPGVRFRHRDGYRSKPVAVRMSDRVEGALVYDLQSNPMGVRVRIADTQPADRGTFRVSLQVLVPTSRVALFEQQGVHVGRLRFYVAAMDFDGGRAPVQEVEVPLRLAPEQTEREYLIYPMQLLLRGGDQRVAVGVWDEIGASASFLSETIAVGAR